MRNETIKLGQVNCLEVVKQVDFGFYLDGGSINGEILLPNGEVEDGANVRVGEYVECFIYLDTEERLVATMHKPQAMVGDFAFLEVAWVNNYGAFLHWGPLKDLFVPFREQKMKMQKGQSYIVHVHLDEDTYRIMASAKVERYLETPPLSSHGHCYRPGDEVDVLIWQKTELGLKAIVDNKYGGLIYDSQTFRQLRTGDRVKAYISQVRPDGKIDLLLQRPGMEAVHDFSDVLLQHLQTNGGFTPLGDKSPAEEIYAIFGVSKKVFKKAIGDLYKKRLIYIEDGKGIILLPQW